MTEKIVIRKFDINKDLDSLLNYYSHLELDRKKKIIRYIINKFGQKNYSLYYDNKFAGFLQLGNLKPFYFSLILNKACYLLNLKSTNLLFKLFNKIGLLKYFEISNVFILNEFRGKGLSKVLVNFALDEAKKLNHKRLYLLVNEKNDIAINLYTKQGFIKDKPFFYNQKKLIMYKDLF